MDGLAIARERISREADAKTGFLDLGGLGLHELPEELFALSHLRRLNLGAGYRDEQGQWHDSASRFPQNDIAAHLGRLAALKSLQCLSLFSMAIVDLTPLNHLASLQSLDCSGTEV